MNSYERFFARLNGTGVDKIPNLNIVMSFAAKFAGIPYSRFCNEPACMVEANLRCHEAFGIDVVTTMSDPYAEASDFGAVIEYPYDSNPLCKKLVLEEYSDLKKLKPKDIGQSGRMLKRLEVLELYRQKIKGVCPIVGWVEGAFAEFIDLRGMNNAMMDLYDNMEFVREAMAICTEQAVIFAREQVKAGADVIGIGDAAASLIGEKIYRELVLPFERKISDEIHKAGAKVKLHICGNIGNLLDHIADSGADIIDIDWMVDLEAARRKTAGKAMVNGNYDPVGVLLQGSPSDVREAVKRCIGSGSAFVSAGCEVPVSTRHENMLAADEALRVQG